MPSKTIKNAWNAGELSQYMDGRTDDDSASVLNIGNSTAVARTFDGLISDVQIYNKALSVAEALSIYSQTRGRYGV